MDSRSLRPVDGRLRQSRSYYQLSGTELRSQSTTHEAGRDRAGQHHGHSIPGLTTMDLRRMM